LRLPPTPLPVSRLGLGDPKATAPVRCRNDTSGTPTIRCTRLRSHDVGTAPTALAACHDATRRPHPVFGTVAGPNLHTLDTACENLPEGTSSRCNATRSLHLSWGSTIASLPTSRDASLNTENPKAHCAAQRILNVSTPTNPKARFGQRDANPPVTFRPRGFTPPRRVSPHTGLGDIAPRFRTRFVVFPLPNTLCHTRLPPEDGVRGVPNDRHT